MSWGVLKNIVALEWWRRALQEYLAHEKSTPPKHPP
jgi:hypothetical protein